MRNIANQDIRKSIDKAGLRHWQVADALGKSKDTFSIWLRKPLKGEKRKLVLAAIEKAKKEYGDDAE